MTRFVSVVPRRHRPARSPHERTSLLPVVPQAFRARAVALSWIQSWPTGQAAARHGGCRGAGGGGAVFGELPASAGGFVMRGVPLLGRGVLMFRQ